MLKKACAATSAAMLGLMAHGTDRHSGVEIFHHHPLIFVMVIVKTTHLIH